MEIDKFYLMKIGGIKYEDKKVLKIIGVLLAILIIVFLIHTIRNYVIVTGLQNKIKPYFNSSNYYMKSVTTSNDGTTVTMDYYKKENKQVAFLERNLNGEISKDSETIIDKNTGLLVKLTFGEEQSEKEYKFDNVDDSIFIEPDISEYTLKEKE